MKTTETYYIGIDVSKENLDVFIRRDKRVRTIANRAKSIERLIAELAEQHENIHLVCEASGAMRSLCSRLRSEPGDRSA